MRRGESGFRARTQSSIAVSADGQHWTLFNASPDVRQQIADNPPLQPGADGPLRHSPITAVVLTNADVDHIAGLLSLRERQPFTLYATARVLQTLAENTIFRVLDPEVVERRELPLEGTVEIDGPEGALGLVVTTFVVPGKVALFLEDESAEGGNFGTEAGDTIGVAIAPADAPDKGLFYIPGCAAVDDGLRNRLQGAACLLFDGTVFTDTEMSETGVGPKTGTRMGHMAISGAEGSLAALASTEIGRRIYVHINNTNPILSPGSDAERTVIDAGWEIAFDGMELEL